jgi:hypothetical protein
MRHLTLVLGVNIISILVAVVIRVGGSGFGVLAA